MYANAVPIGKPFDKAKCVEEKLKLLSDMCITLSQREMDALNALNTPRQIENFIRSIISNRWN
jgi:hypothetical protein